MTLLLISCPSIGWKFASLLHGVNWGLLPTQCNQQTIASLHASWSQKGGQERQETLHQRTQGCISHSVAHMHIQDVEEIRLYPTFTHQPLICSTRACPASVPSDKDRYELESDLT